MIPISDEFINYFKSVYNTAPSREEAQDILSKEFAVTTRTIRNWAKQLNFGNKVENHDEIMEKAKVKEVHGNCLMFTWGQKSTPVHKKFFNNMLAYANFRGAQIGVIAGRYKNPTSIFKSDDEEDWWDPLIVDHLTTNRHNVSKNTSILSDVKVQPTASMPMTGFEGFENEVSIVIGHPRVQMKVVATLEGYRKKKIFTTGACTLMNYTDSKAGKKGEFHHTLGFVIIENEGNDTYMRHVTACDDGSFIDLIYSVDNNVVVKDSSCVDVYCCGDKHFGETDPAMEQVGRKMIEILNPDYVRMDDVFNGHSISHHEKNSPVQLYKRYVNGESLLKVELELLKEGLEWYNNKSFKVLITKSNHDIFLDRYIDSNDWKKDIPNALDYMRCATLLLEGSAPKGLIPYFINSWYPDFITLGTDESFRLSSFEMSVHGDLGANGTRGSVIQLKNLSTKMVTAHTHSPSRYDGVVTVGTNTYLRAGYNKGPSSWMHCDTIIHKNGKAQLLIFENYKCTTIL